MKRFGTIFTAATLTALTAQAHPGHSPLSEGAAHFLSSPSHMVPWLFVSAAMACVAQLLKARNQRALLRAAAAAAAVFALVG